MRAYKWGIVFLMALLFVSDAWALGLGGGGGLRIKRGRKSSTTQNTVDEERKNMEELHKQHVQQMPPAEKVADLDTSAFDRIAGQLGLQDPQAEQIEALKNRIRNRGAQLTREQEQARQKFETAKEIECAVVVPTVIAASQSCKGFNPGNEFNVGLANILSPDQRTRLKEALDGKRAHAPAKKSQTPVANAE